MLTNWELEISKFVFDRKKNHIIRPVDKMSMRLMYSKISKYENQVLMSMLSRIVEMYSPYYGDFNLMSEYILQRI